MPKVSVDLTSETPYLEQDTAWHSFKRRLTYRAYLRMLSRHLPKNEPISLLDVGTGSGYFLKTAKEWFPAASLFGVEYDPRLVEETLGRVPDGQIIQGNAEEFGFGQTRFDAIASFQVIEHLYDPERMVATARNALKPGGLFLFTTPNLTGLGARVMKDRWTGYRDDHVSLKGMDEWIQLGVDGGFEPLYTGSTFFSGIPWLNKLPLGPINWALLLILGTARWGHGESFCGLFRKP